MSVLPYMMARRRRLGSGAPSALTFVASATSVDTASITIPATAAEGDLAILQEYNFDFSHPARIVPAGWTALDEYEFGGDCRCWTAYKVLEAGDPGAAYTSNDGGGTANNKSMFVFRPDSAITAVTPSAWNGEIEDSSLSAQTVLASGGAAPLVVVAAAAVGNTTDRSLSSNPAFDATVLNADGDMRSGYKIYNSSPADHSISTIDQGVNNALWSGYLQVA